MATGTTTTRTTITASGASGDESPALKPVQTVCLTLEAVANAYFSCRRQKRNRLVQLAFEAELETNLVQLYEELTERRYKIGPSTAFVVTYPSAREIWAAQFRDRVVHHLVYEALRGRHEPRFIRDSYACIPGRGAHAAANRAEVFARRVTHSWRRPAYILQCDIRSFFNTIDRNVLFDLLEPSCQEAWLRNLVRMIVFSDPREGVTICGDPKLFARVPPHKSLWNNPPHKGLPIGNLTSQFFANVYLNELDQFVKHDLRCPYYVRYVDDFILFHPCSNQLNSWHAEIANFVSERLLLALHPRKTRIAPVHQGFDFVGYVQKPGRRYPRRKTVRRAHHKVTLWEQAGGNLDFQTTQALCNSLNSYLGLMRQGNAHRQQSELCARLPALFFDVTSDFNKVLPRQAACRS